MTSRRDGFLLGGAFVTFAISAALMHSYSVFLVAFPRGIPLEPRRDVAGLLDLRAGEAARARPSSAPWWTPRPSAPRAARRKRPHARAPGQRYIAALWQIVVLYGILMTLGANCLGLVVFVPVLSRRFVRNRGMAISVVQSANGFARAVSAPLAQLAISAIGWRHAYLAQAALMGVLVWDRSPPCFDATSLSRGLLRRACRRRAVAWPPPVRRAATGRLPKRWPPVTSGSCSRSTCARASGASSSRCTSSPSPWTPASTSSTPPPCSASARSFPSAGRSSPERCRTTSGASSRPSWPTRSRSSA